MAQYRTVVFDAKEHDGHNVFGSETAHYSGALYATERGEWYLGTNQSDQESLDWQVDGCYDCLVEFIGVDERKDDQW